MALLGASIPTPLITVLGWSEKLAGGSVSIKNERHLLLLCSERGNLLLQLPVPLLPPLHLLLQSLDLVQPPFPALGCGQPVPVSSQTSLLLLLRVQLLVVLELPLVVDLVLGDRLQVHYLAAHHTRHALQLRQDDVSVVVFDRSHYSG